MSHSNHEPSEPVPGWQLPMKIGFLVLLGITTFFLVGDHWVHLAGYLPWLIFLLCPLMHLFMHGGHGGHDHGNSKDENDGNRKTH